MPWLNVDEMRAWRAYIETAIDLQNAIERDLAPHGLTLGDYQVLVYLSEADDHRMRMRDLAALLQLSPSGLTRRLDGLVKARLVERQPSPDDGRVIDQSVAAGSQVAPGTEVTITVGRATGPVTTLPHSTTTTT